MVFLVLKFPWIILEAIILCMIWIQRGMQDMHWRWNIRMENMRRSVEKEAFMMRQ